MPVYNPPKTSSGGGSGTPGGSDTQVQFNDSSSFGASSGLTFDKTNLNLVAGGSINAGATIPVANSYFRAVVSGSLASGSIGYTSALTKTGGSSGTITGFRSDVTLNATMTNFNMLGLNFNVGTSTTGGVTPVLSNGFGFQGNVSNVTGATFTNATAGYLGLSNAGTAGTWRGLQVQLTQSGAGTTITTAYLVQPQLNANLLGTIGTLAGIALNGWGSNTGTITTSYGILADTTIDKGATSYFIYSTSVSPSVFSGDIQLIDKNLVFGTATGTKIGTATNQKLSLWNAAPIVQPTTGIAAATFVANTSGIADDSATFDGYTIGQVVKALRNTGLLA